MEKLTSILAVALEADSAMQVLDKAAAVAARFGASVEVLIDDSVPLNRVTARCEENGYRDINLYSVASAPESGYETAMRRIWSLRPDLVVKAPAADGSDWEFANECPAPVLLVRGGAWEQPTRFAAAVDVSDEDNASLARSILHTAGFLALGTHGNLDILYSEREAQDETLRMRRAVRLAQLVREFHVGCERLQIYSGDPARRLPPLVAARRYDVLVLGGESPGDDLRRTVPDTVRNLVAATASDVVLVKAPALNQTFEGNLAWREQRRAEGR